MALMRVVAGPTQASGVLSAASIRSQALAGAPRSIAPFPPSSRQAPTRAGRRSAVKVAAQSPAPWKANAPPVGSKDLSLELPSADVQKALELVALPRGRGKVIVVARVDPGSECYAAGVRPGQQVLEVSDPVRAGETWQLDGKSSLKYVREAIQGRGLESCQLRLTANPAPEYEQLVAGMEADGEGGSEAAQKLERQYNLQRLQAAAAAQERAAQEARLAKRQSFIDAQQSKRQLEPASDSKPLFAGALSLLLLLPLAVVGIALTTGAIGPP